MGDEGAVEAASQQAEAGRGVRYGRPRRELAGQVEERILDAAGRVFLEHGFQGASVDEIAEAASAGKPTIYARFPSKQALFTAVIERLVRRNTSLDAFACAGGSIEERLDALAALILTRVLTPETIGLIRVSVAEARRFPDLAISVSCMGRERPTDAVARVFGELAAVRRHRRIAGLRAGKTYRDRAAVSRPCGLADAGEGPLRRGSRRATRRDRAARRPVGRLLSRRLRLRAGVRLSRSRRLASSKPSDRPRPTE